MCGIFGAFGPGVDVEDGLAALRTLSHRGPDALGHAGMPGSAGFLGHARLAIIDLSATGAQPMTNEDDTLFLTFNGEIYNHERLRADLISKGHVFRGRCDAEVILHLYEELGADLVDELEGMFAFALWDSKRSELLLARDRLGIKPLYYYDDGARLVFASELKAIRAFPGLDQSPDPTAFYDYLTYQYVPAPKTVLAKVKKLPAAHRLTWRPGGPAGAPERWWRVEEGIGPFTDEASALAELERLLQQSVAGHLVSDVPVGVFLSAGVDSTLVASVATEIAGRAPHAFTIGFEGRADDEAEDARDIAERLGAEHRVGGFGLDELVRNIARMPAIFDEPFADASALPCIELCRMASEHGKVMLSGDGGDETHAGYGRYVKRGKRQSSYELARRIPGLAGLAGMGSLPSVPWVRALRESELGVPYSFHMGLPREAKRLLIDFGDDTFDDYDDYWAIREYVPALDTLQGQQRMDLATHLAEGILTKVDRTSMLYGLEVRPPLLDHRLVEFGLRLPDALKIRADEQKPLLRALLARRMPASVSGAKKRAFSVPLKAFVRDGVVGPRGDVDVKGAFRVRKDLLERWFSPSKDHHLYWMLHVLESFLRHEEREPAA